MVWSDFFSFCHFRLLWPKNHSSEIWSGQPICPPGPTLDPLPYHNVPYCTPKHHATRIGCCTMRVQTLGGVWERLEVFAARYVVWGPSEGRTESEGVRSQVGPQIPPNTPQTPPHANICFIWCIYMVYEVVGCVWCQRWAVHGR